MVGVEQWAELRRLHFVKGVSIRELQRRTGLHRTTIRRALRVYWLINVSLKSGAALSRADLVPPSPTVQNYSSIFENADFTAALRNSAIVTATTTLLALLVGSFAAYALARLRFPMKFLLLAVVLSISTSPRSRSPRRSSKLWTDIGLYNTYPGLIIPYLTFALPLCIYILASFFKEIPRELEERRSSTVPRTSRRSARACCRWLRRAW